MFIAIRNYELFSTDNKIKYTIIALTYVCSYILNYVATYVPPISFYSSFLADLHTYVICISYICTV